MRQNTSFGAMIALCALALSVSCQKEIQEPNPEPSAPESRAETRTFTCVMAGDADSKVAIDSEGKTAWEVGDEILIHGERLGTYNGKMYSTVVTLTAEDISADGKTATITFTTDPDGVNGIIPYVHMNSSGEQDYESTLYAAYPAGAIDMSVSRCYYHNPFSETNQPLMIAYDDGNSFAFNPVGSVISFTMPSGLDFDSFAFSGNNGEIVGYDRFTAKVAKKSDGSISEYYPYTSGDLGTGQALFGPQTVISAPVVCDGTTLNQICIPGKLEFTGGFKIMFLKDGEIVKYVSNKGAFTLKRGDCLPLGDISSHLKTYSSSSHTSSIPTEGAIDLGANGTANSYIVYKASAPGAVYKFKAMKGNSSTESVGGIASVDVLWETWNNAETVTQHSVVAAADFEGDYIYIQMPETLHAGNAVIAARNAAGIIRWSWHIWVPATEIETRTYGIFDKGLMDRNLGSLVAATADDDITIESFGLNYQWGRKDPFVGASAIGSSSNATVAGVVLSATEGDGEADESKITLEQSIENPTLLGHTKNGDWVTPSDNSLWKNAEKTIYDPCPPGYRVPARDKSQPWHSADLTTVTGWAEADNWFTLGNPVAVFPFAGYRDDYVVTGLSHTYDRAVYWTSYASSDAVGYYVNVRKESKHALSEVAKARAGSVRCVTEEAFVDPDQPTDVPVMGEVEFTKKLRVSDDNYVPELSGLCLSKDGDFLWGVDDNGGLYHIDFDGTFSLHWDKSAEMEGLAMDPATGTMYIGLEDDTNSGYVVPSPDYNSKTSFGWTVEGVSDMGNSGVEGITLHKGDLYLGTQTGATLFCYTLDGQLKWKKSLRTVCSTISEIAGLDYDEENDRLWVIDSNSNSDKPQYDPYTIYLFNGDATELIAKYYIGDFADWNPEAICVDKANGCIWVGEDCGDEKFSILHKVRFSGL